MRNEGKGSEQERARAAPLPSSIGRRLVKLYLAILLSLAPTGAQPVAAQGFKPGKPIEIVTLGAGGGGDVLARALAGIADKDKLLPVRVQVTNKAAGNSAAAMAYLAEKKGDAHTMGIFTGIWFTSPIVNAEHKVTLKELTPIVRLVLEPGFFVVKTDSPYKTLKDFIDAAKKSPWRLKQAGGSITSRDNVMRWVLQKHTGAQWAYISFPGTGERIAALLGGQVNILVIDAREAAGEVRAGKLRVLAQLSDKRLPSFPNVPTLQEAGFDVPNVPQVRGVVAPPGIRPEAVAYWEEFFARIVRTPSWKKYLEDNQFEDGFQRSAELGKFFDEFSSRMRDVLKDAGVKVVR